jgi:hypothetical protein
MTMTRGVVRKDVVGVQTATRVELLSTLASTGLQPQQFVRSAHAWPVVEAAASDVAQTIQLVRRRHEIAPLPTLEKMWAEATYEAVRRRELPDAPSRLECLYAVELGYDASDILPELGLTRSTFAPSGFPTTGPMIIPARTRGRWVPVDMRLFQVPPQLAPDPGAITAARDATLQLAERYWAGDASAAPVTELLCEGLDVDGWAGYAAPPTA